MLSSSCSSSSAFDQALCVYSASQHKFDALTHSVEIVRWCAQFAGVVAIACNALSIARIKPAAAAAQAVVVVASSLTF